MCSITSFFITLSYVPTAYKNKIGECRISGISFCAEYFAVHDPLSGDCDFPMLITVYIDANIQRSPFLFYPMNATAPIQFFLRNF